MRPVAACLVSVSVCVAQAGFAQPSQHALPPTLRIAAAVSAAPPALRAGATVMDYDSTGSLVTVREGTGLLICLADNPARKSFHVACYDRELEPFMARGRALRAQHVSDEETDSIRAREIRGGKLAMPRHPTALYQYVAARDSVDAAAGVIHGASYLYIVYMPFATPETTGFPAEPLSDGGPWLMYPGKPWAHLMIGPPRSATITLGK
jgi:hypothetical protein